MKNTRGTEMKSLKQSEAMKKLWQDPAFKEKMERRRLLVTKPIEELSYAQIHDRKSRERRK